MARQLGNRHSRALAAVAAVIVTSLVAAGCATTGGSSSSTSGAACNTPGYSANEIQLGFIYPNSGAVAPALSASKSGFDARIAEANAAGGIYGRKIVTSWRDDAGTPGQNLEAAQDLIERQKVFGLVEATVAAGGSAEYLRKANVPVSGIAAEALWADPKYRNMFEYSYVFTTGPSVTTFGDYAKSQGGTKAAIIESDGTANATDIGAKIGTSLAAAGIPTAPGHFLYSPNAVDPEKLGEQLKAAHVDVVVAAFAGDQLAELVRGIKAGGASLKVILAPSGYDSSLVRKYGKTLSGLTAAVAYVPFQIGDKAHQDYLRAMSNFAPELQPPDQELAFVTYILTDLFLYGLQKAGPCPTRAGYIDALRASTYTSGLLPGPVDMTKDFGQIARCYTFMRVNDAGTGYDVVPSAEAGATDRNQWCGQRLTQ
ncbi:ABC transporter substrate-binding protein [Pseudofrankia inefficax]|uniref:Extracellular ligand-binding receptor n=1 Tax=Pseudofrankia inefficax (strain DSM 45817 / CECT 9037 / DDB 130130 / EuI1c) TaxID=298654 RepID=E3JDE7_PSEI1|nr:ABC transporter substrate-binding protein [Pseudofrankia inefficax]ADP83580.1 Extracellular ligand-binding receptor [Pseudofrankia inefficax]